MPRVAIKLVNPDFAADAQTAGKHASRPRIPRAARPGLRHPNTIQVLDFGQSESGALFLVMEYLRGRTLAKILEDEGVVTSRRIAELLGQALSALDEAHASGVVHRDFKPENVFVEALRTGKEHVKVLDFGIAKLRGEADAGLTSRGAVCGTPEYMSPEQIRGEELDARSDVYGAGVVLYELMTGTRPFESRGPVIEVLQAHLNQPPQPPRLRRPDLNLQRPLEDVCLKALAKEVDKRYRSAAELKAAIEVAVRGLTGEHCPSCGMPLSGSARFCSECGTVLRPTRIATPVPGPESAGSGRLASAAPAAAAAAAGRARERARPSRRPGERSRAPRGRARGRQDRAHRSLGAARGGASAQGRARGRRSHRRRAPLVSGAAAVVAARSWGLSASGRAPPDAAHLSASSSRRSGWGCAKGVLF